MLIRANKRGSETAIKEQNTCRKINRRQKVGGDNRSEPIRVLGGLIYRRNFRAYRPFL